MTHNGIAVVDRVSADQGDHLRPFEIIVAMDSSAISAAALDWAAEQSRLTGVPLRMVYVWQHNAAGIDASSAAFWAASAADARARATRWVLDMLGGGASSLRWVLDIVRASPGPVLVGASGGASLLVLGMREARRQPATAALHRQLGRVHAVASQARNSRGS